MIGYNKSEIVGKMRERVILQNRIITQSDSGFQSEIYSDIGIYWSKIEYKTGFEEEDADKLSNQQKINITLRYNILVNVNSRFVYRNELYQVEKVEYSDDRRFMICVCVWRSSYTSIYAGSIFCSASLLAQSSLSAALMRVIKYQASLNAFGSVSADISFVQKVASSLNANALLSGDISFVQKAQANLSALASLTGDINFVQKAQASLLTSANVTGNLTIPKTFNASLLATGTTTANLTVNAPSASLLLDLYPNAGAAYSLRKLRTAYTGSAIRVRRSIIPSGQPSEQDIGFVTGQLDTASLLAFCGAGNGFVTTWYDQSGNARNATQTTQANQPQIVNSGVIIISNGEPIIDFNGTNSYLNGHWSSLFTSTTDNFALFNVLKFDVDNTLQVPFGVTDGTTTANGNLSNALIAYSTNSASFHRVNGEILNYSTSISAEFGIINDNLLVYQKNGIVTNVYNNNILKATQNFTTTLLGNVPTNTSFFMRFGTNRGFLAQWFNGNMKEFIIYPTSQSINISAINSNINTYYGIY